MSEIKVIAKSNGSSEMQYEGSFGTVPATGGAHNWTMELMECDGDNPPLMIEWDIPSLEEVSHIGIWVNWKKELTDYDGTCCALNIDMVALLEKAGIKVGMEFTAIPEILEALRKKPISCNFKA
jgi:hypothetical protein